MTYDIETGVALAQAHLRTVENAIPHLERAREALDQFYDGYGDDLYTALVDLIKRFKGRENDAMLECIRREEEMEALKNGI